MKSPRHLHYPGLTLAALGFALLITTDTCAQEPQLPQGWAAAWRQPPAEDRPLQIVHGIPAKRASVAGMQHYKDLGLGGLVANVAFDQYLQSDEHWQTLQAGVAACRELGLVVWLYDEEGYPSGGAGGLALEGHPEFEATALAFDPSRDDPFLIRPSYEHTHASNNYHAARRYLNLIDDRAVRRFLEVTHEAYRQRLDEYFGGTIEATFTDEPSLMAVNIGQLPEEVRSRVRVTDPLDPQVQPLPSVPWCYDLPDRYRQRYGEDLLSQRRSLFTGDAEEDRRVRQQFWALVADLIAQRYFGAIQQWCGKNRLASSGHTLAEETILFHVPLEGNALKALSRMDIPGLDMLTSEPAVVLGSGWLTASLPSSAAMLCGGRRVMTEISDFSQKMAKKGPAGLPEMQAAAAWQAAWGVTDFTLYYRIEDRPAEAYRSYCDYVGRLNAVLKPAGYDRQVLLYYPIRDLWAEYRPVAERLTLDTQSPRARRIVESFMHLGRLLQRSQIPFTLVDHDLLGAAAVESGALKFGEHRFASLVVPDGVELPAGTERVVEKFRQSGGQVLADGPESATRSRQGLLDALRPAHRIEPASDQIALGRFRRDGRTVLLVVNVGTDAYAGRLICASPAPWLAADPANGSVAAAERDTEGQTILNLAPRQALLLIQ